MIGSYPTVFQIGHKAIKDIFNAPIIAEEKIDGSQFSFGVNSSGELECRSKGKQIVIDAPDNMFQKAVDTILQLRTNLHFDWIYRCEYLQKPKHNALAYDRTPFKNLIVFDIETAPQTFLNPEEKKAEADRLGLECVPVLYSGKVSDFSMFKELLETKSILGNVKIEGIVFKNYELFTIEKKVAIGKYVSESFKEVHDGEWKKSNPTPTDIVLKLIYEYKTDARYQKAIQHLAEKNELTNTPKDIGALIKEIGQDTAKECEDEIKDKLWREFWPKVQRGILAGFPEWYKEYLAKQSFEGK